MRTIEIARQLAAYGQVAEACQAYALAIHDSAGQDPQSEMEGALYIFQSAQSGGDYKVAYTAFQNLYNRGQFQEDCLHILTSAFYEPNEKQLRSTYEKNCKLLRQYPYLFREDFPAFEELPIKFYPYDDRGFVPFYPGEKRFGGYVNFNHPVVSRNFFKDLDNPILAEDVFSQYELEYLNDNVRDSEYVGRDNHIYLHYTDWGVFCSYLQCLNFRLLLKDKKLVFLIGEETARYPIDFKAEFGIDYAIHPVKPLGIREVHRLIWHTQLATHNGGDFFNEIFDAHPNLMALPSIMFDNTVKAVENVAKALDNAHSLRDATQRLSEMSPRLAEELYLLNNRTEKDIFVALFLNEKGYTDSLDRAARIAPALFFQPHFPNMVYDLKVDRKNRTTLYSEMYEQVRVSPLFRNFKYIKTFTPMRRPTTSHGATVKFMYQTALEPVAEGEVKRVVPDAVAQRILNRSFMIDWQDRLFKDSVLVRFEDAKLNPKATFAALAAFLDLPYTESMTYCSLKGERDPESLKGNDLGFSTAAVYRTYDDYANGPERYFIEYFLRDAYEFYGYGFQTYDGEAMGRERIETLVQQFDTVDRYIAETWGQNVFGQGNISVNGEPLPEEKRLEIVDELVKKQLAQFRENRLTIAKVLLQGLRFVNKKGQPLHMMPKLELDPALLEQPLYH